MNSLQKTTVESHAAALSSFLSAFEESLKAKGDAREVEIILKQLQHLALHWDPFSGEADSTCGEVMNSLGIKAHLEDPYEATNILLRLLDKTEERLNILKQ